MTLLMKMMKWTNGIARWGVVFVLVLVTFAGVALAQPAPGSTPAGDPAGSTAAAPADSTRATPGTSTTSPTAPTSPADGDARKACTTAMNADPKFAADMIATLHDIERTADPKLAAEIIATVHDMDTIKVHTDAMAHVQKNEQHVIYAYAAMWIVAALFVIFLWRRQQALQAEIATLRRDLEAAADEATADKARS